MTDPEFHRLIDENLPQLIATARRIACNEQLAAEALQDAMLRAWKHRGGFNQRSSLTTWLTRILVNCVRDAIDSAARQGCHTQSWPETDNLSQAFHYTADPADPVIADETISRVQREVSLLPPRQREVFALMVWENLDSASVSELLGISPQAVHASLHAARCQLRQRLSDLNSNLPDAGDQ